MHGEEQRERRAHRLLAAATQAAVLHLTAKQFSNDGVAGGAQRAAGTQHKLGISKEFTANRCVDTRAETNDNFCS